MLALAGAGPDWIGGIWLAAVLWTIAATLVHALWSGLRHGDWSAFTCEGCCASQMFCAPQVFCPPQVLERDDEDIDWSSRTGRYAYLRIGARHEALMRDGDGLSGESGHVDSLP